MAEDGKARNGKYRIAGTSKGREETKQS